MCVCLSCSHKLAPQNAKYAGPRDEYICTGSDSGHAWIFERATGTVASFLSADESTCNGVVPHPSLPFFITYGIDSTAKLWRATNPVDRDADDSPLVCLISQGSLERHLPTLLTFYRLLICLLGTSEILLWTSI